MLVPLPPLRAMSPRVTSRMRSRWSVTVRDPIKRSFGRICSDREYPCELVQSEDEFLAGYDPSKYPPVAVTVDVVLLTVRAGRLSVLLVQRAGHPFRGQWALPGGFVE